ncbi:MFS transporter [Kitasatospora sp. NPDC057223]|uniref:MFS transporter n=1 Tax=Kitasatospora sp. NPDC057223 TaxID=3346055 RepID=UPI003624D44F
MKLSSLAPPAPAPTATGRWSLALWGLLTVLAGNMLIDALEVSVAVVALPSIGADLGLAPTTLQWAMSGFAVGFGGLMLFGARVVALLGRRRVYLVALLVFAAASVLSGLTSDPGVLIATRFVKGFCAALTAPTGLAIISTTFPEGPARNRALSVYTLFGASGFTAGLLLSGLLTQVSWRLTFLFPAPVVLVLFALGLRLIPEAPAAGPAPAGPAPRRFGVAGAVTFSGALLALVYGIVSVPGHGWADPRSAGAFALGALLLAAFAVTERTSAQPLLGFRALANGAMVRSALGAAALNGSYLGLLLTATYELQTLAGWTPLQTALAFVPASAPLAVAALSAGRIVTRFGAARLIALGAVFPCLGYALFLRLSWPFGYAAAVLPTMLLVGAGFVLSFAALNLQATSGLPAERRGAGSGLYQTAVQVGAALMLALVAALIEAARPAAGAPVAEAVAALRPALWLVTAVGLLGLLTGLSGVLKRRR